MKKPKPSMTRSEQHNPEGYG